MFEPMKQSKGLLTVEGIVFMLLGILAILVPTFFTLALELVIGWLILISGLIQTALSFRKAKGNGFFGSLLGGILSIAVGILLVKSPLQGMLTLTLVLAAFFMIEGILEIVLGLELRGASSRWGWFVVSGITAIFLSVIIWSGFPGTANWTIGLILGINMLFFGMALLSFSRSV